MPLIKAQLESEILNHLSSNNVAGVTNAKNLANAIAAYWDQGLSNLGGSVTSAPGKSIMAPMLVDAYTGNKTFTDFANKVTDAIDSGFKAIIISGGKHGVGGIQTTQPGILKAGLLDYLSGFNEKNQAAKKLAAAIHDYTSQGQVYGTGVPPDFTQPSGPLQ